MTQAAPYPAHLDRAEREGPVIPNPVLSQPGFARLQRMRRRFSWTLTAAMLMAYFGFILTLAFQPELLAAPLVSGRPMTVGIPIGFGMFMFTFALVAVYVHRSNTVYDKMIADIRQGEPQ